MEPADETTMRSHEITKHEFYIKKKKHASCEIEYFGRYSYLQAVCDPPIARIIYHLAGLDRLPLNTARFSVNQKVILVLSSEVHTTWTVSTCCWIPQNPLRPEVTRVGKQREPVRIPWKLHVAPAPSVRVREEFLSLPLSPRARLGRSNGVTLLPRAPVRSTVGSALRQ